MREGNVKAEVSKPKYRKVSSSAKQARNNPNVISTRTDSQFPTGDIGRESSLRKKTPLQQDSTSSSKGIAHTLLQLIKKFASLLARIFVSLFHIIGRFFSLGASKIVHSKAVLLIISILIVAAASLGVDALANKGKVYQGVRVGAIEAGGMNVDELEEAILMQYRPLFEDKKIYVFSDEEASLDLEAALEATYDSTYSDQHTTEETRRHKKVWETSTEELDVSLDAATLADMAYAYGRTDGGLFARFNLLLHAHEIPISLSYGEEAIDSLASDIDKAIGIERINYGIEMVDSLATVTPGRDGDMVNRKAFSEEITTALFEGKDDARIVAWTEEAPLQITEKTAQKICDDINLAISNGAVLLYNDEVWEVTPAELSQWIQVEEIESEGIWTLCPSLNYSIARPALHAHMKAYLYEEDTPVKFSLEGDTILVTPESEGTIPLSKNAIGQLNTLLFVDPVVPSEIPQVEVGSTAIPEVLEFDEALELGIVDLVSSFTTEYTSGMENRNHNIHLMADLLSRSIIPANGGEWSLNEISGDYNEEAGFKSAGAIADGEFIDSIGGGVCQVATTVFNSVYHAGYTIVARQNHSLYMPSYPDGLDAAVSWPYPDLKWRNDTSSDVLLLSSYTDTSVTISLYSVDPGYTVTSAVGAWEKGEEYSTEKVYDESLAPGTTRIKAYGVDGFKIIVTRTVKDAQGKIVSEQVFESIYDPVNEIILEGPKLAAENSTAA